MKSSSLIYIPFLFLLGSCAIQSTPSGGPEDKTAPIVIEEFPENKSIWFTSKEIIIKLDEFVNLKNANQEVLISPPLETSPDIKLKGKSVILKLNSELQDSTTYTLQFGNAISDITEGNVLKDYQYVFSTGGELDSLSLVGRVQDAFTKEAVEDIKVLLYESGNDSGVFTQKPRYFARSNKSGEFKFQNLKAGKYTLYAIDDQNRNYYYNDGEMVSFYSQPIQLISDSQGFNLQLFTNSIETQKLKGAEGIKPGKSIFYFTKAIVKHNLSLLNQKESDTLMYSLSSGKDSIFAWTPGVYLDTSEFLIRVDSRINDTITIRYKNLKESKKTTIEINKRIDYYGLSKSISVRCEEPVLRIDTSKIIIYEDTILLGGKFVFERNKENPLLINISDSFLPGKNYRFYINKNSFEGISGRKNDSMLISFMIRDEKDLGAMSINVNSSQLTDGENLIVELLNAKKKMVRRKTIQTGGEETISFKDLIPGKYDYRFIVDANKNNRWDTGNIENQVQPEAVYYLNQKIELKANWEILDLNFSIPEN